MKFGEKYNPCALRSFDVFERHSHTTSAAARRKICRRLASEMGKTKGRQEDGYGSGSVQFTKMRPTSKKYPILIDHRLQTVNFASEFHIQFTSSSVTDFSDPHSMWMVMTASQPEQRACPTPDICMRIVIAVSAPGSQSKPQLGQVIFIRCLLYKAITSSPPSSGLVLRPLLFCKPGM